MAFVLFLLVNATLFLRPAEIIPEWQGISLYEYLIIACFVFALPDILTHLTGRPLEAQPVTLCVFGVLAAVVLSQLPSFNFGEAWRTGFFVFKVVVYYVLLISVVNTGPRLKMFIGWLVCCCVLLALITLLQYHEVLTLPTLKSVTDTDMDRVTGEVTTFGRLQGSGIFNDPNELGVMLATAVPLALYLLADPKSVLRFVFVLPLGIFFYAVYLTQSRGAFLALVAGLGGWALARFGGRRAVGFALVGLPVLLVFFAGRQTSLSASQGTGQTRIQIWSDWLTEFRESPLFGKGMSLSEEDPDAIKERMEWEGKKHVAHNSYLHSFRDLGLVGGMFFLGAFLLAFWSLARLSPGQAQVLDPEMARLRPFLLGALAAFALGILSLSLCYSIPTYMVLGLVTAYGRVTPCRAVKPALSWDLNIAGRIALAGVGFLAFTYMIVRVFGGSG